MAIDPLSKAIRKNNKKLSLAEPTKFAKIKTAPFG
jgi:hypothetical protein